jgi:hypothetical protein
VAATGQPYSYASDDTVNNVDPTGLCNAQGNGNAWDLFNPWIAKLRAVHAATHPAGNDAGGADIRILPAAGAS